MVGALGFKGLGVREFLGFRVLGSRVVCGLGGGGVAENNNRGGGGGCCFLEGENKNRGGFWCLGSLEGWEFLGLGMACAR